MLQSIFTHLLAIAAGACGMYIWMKIGAGRRDKVRDAVSNLIDKSKSKLP